MPWAEGAQFAGYTVQHLVGAGTLGEVYLARHPRLPRHEALKILRAEVSADPDYRRQFGRNADSAAALWHPHIVGVHDHGEFNGQLWIATDLVEGPDSAALLGTRGGGLPSHEVADIVAAAADALDYAHHRGLLHRGVKPTNILVNRPDPGGAARILVADFGQARPVGDSAGTTVNTVTADVVDYCAPEQLAGQPLTGRADQYALAATAYHLLTGTKLFGHHNPVAVISAHLMTTAPPPSRTHPELGGADPVFARALAKDPAERFASCRDFAAALAAALPATPAAPVALTAPTPAGHPDPTRPPPPPPGAPGTPGAPGAAAPAEIGAAPTASGTATRRRTSRLLAAVFAVAVVAAAAGLGIWLVNRHAAQRAAHDREAARLSGQHYLEALAAGEAGTALSLGAQQPATPQLLTDAALRAQLAGTPLTDLTVTADPHAAPGTQGLLLAARFGATASQTPMRARKIDGHWKLDTTTITVAVHPPPHADKAMTFLAVAGISTKGATVLSVFPGELRIGSTNPNIDISAPTVPLLLEALTTPTRPSISPVIALNDTGRQASWAAADAYAHRCHNGSPPPPDCKPAKPPPPGVPRGDPPDPGTLKLLNIEKPPELTYDLDAATMTVHVTGKAFYAAQGRYGGQTAPVNLTAYLDDTVDLTTAPPAVIPGR